MDAITAEADGRSLLPLLLWLSPGFPVGAFAYSHGLEWAVEAGDISDAKSLGGWLVELLLFGSPRNDAILFAESFRAAEAADWSALIDVNALGVALNASAERRLETTAQGAAFVSAARAAWECEALKRQPARSSFFRFRRSQRSTPTSRSLGKRVASCSR